MLQEKRIGQLKKLLLSLEIDEEIDLSLIHQSLIHPSYLSYNGDHEENNQRLEFLGDAVVGLVIGQYLFEKYPHKSEGELTKMRAFVVCESALAYGACLLNLGEFLQMGKGEASSGGENRPSNLADCFEAFMGALYLNMGLERVRTLILKVLKNKINQAVKGNFGNYKAQLQEYIQKNPENHVNYKILHEKGPDHNKQFIAAVYLNDKEAAQGSGRSKKEAEQHAAQSALNEMGVL